MIKTPVNMPDNISGTKIEKRGVLLLNMGGPDSLAAVKPFLYNLFSDRIIIKLGPSILQKPLAYLIAKLKTKDSRLMYEKIGGSSPIKHITMEQARMLEDLLNGNSNGQFDYKVYVGMRYWHPFIKDTIKMMYNSGIRQMAAISLYPHYSLATSGSSFIELERSLREYKILCKSVRSWPINKLYVELLVELINEGLADFGNNVCSDILFSAHSLPEYFIKNGDPYVSELNLTVHSVKEKLPESLNIHVAYQSKGSSHVKWLSPSTKDKIAELAQNQKCKHLLVVPISFVSDHVETLYEIDILYKEQAQTLGIELKRTKSLNMHTTFIDVLKGLVQDTYQVINSCFK